jgi:hypothetical protein
MPFDFAAISVPFRMQPGLRRLAAGAAQLTPNRPGDRHLIEKLAVLRDHAADALMAAPGFDAGPALHALQTQAANECPEAWRREADGSVHAPLLGWGLAGDEVRGDGAPEIGECLRALPATARCTALLCLAFAQDFAVIDGRSSRIPWLAVCLPSFWAPGEKLGHRFVEVHAPVADNQTLLTAAEHLARLVTRSERWERFVWSLTLQKKLDLHPQRTPRLTWPADASVDEIGAAASLRTEHQTFIPLPERAEAVFTIHVEMRPLAEAITKAADAAALHDALATMSPAVLAYRSLADARDRLLAWLAARR